MKEINELKAQAKEMGLEVSNKTTKAELKNMLSSRQEKAKKRERRGGAVIGGNSAKLNRPEYQREGYKRRWFNYEQGRLDAAYNNDYDFVLNSKGEKIKERVWSKEDGSDLYAYLMEKPVDWYEEDQRKKQSIVDQKEKAIKEGNTPGTEDAMTGVTQYQPKEGINISTGISNNKLGD